VLPGNGGDTIQQGDLLEVTLFSLEAQEIRQNRGVIEGDAVVIWYAKTTLINERYSKEKGVYIDFIIQNITTKPMILMFD